MASTRHRRVRAHREQRRARQSRRRPDAVAHRLERIDRFDAALARAVAWGAIAVVVLIAVAAVVS